MKRALTMSALNVDFDPARQPSRNRGEYNKLRTRGFRVQRWPFSTALFVGQVEPVRSYIWPGPEKERHDVAQH